MPPRRTTAARSAFAAAITSATCCALVARATRTGRAPFTAQVSSAASMITRSDPHALGNGPLDALGGNGRARVAAGEDLPRVHHAVGIECRASAVHRLEILGAEDPEHEVVLLETDAVLSGERAARIDGDLEDLGARC